MASVQHTCTGCVPIDASIIEVYIQLLGAKTSANAAAERAEYAAEHAIGKSPYIGANGNWWEWNDERGEFIDTMVQAQGQIAVDAQLDPNSTNPVQNKVTAEELAKKQEKLVSGENIKTVGGQSLVGPGDIEVGDKNAVKFVSQELTDQQKNQARTNIGAYQKPSSGIPASDMTSAVQNSLQLADNSDHRPYNSGNPDGMGYLVLRKNKTFAEQVTKENTIYEIRYDFVLSEDFALPTGCFLRFNGGSISGAYRLTGANTAIQADAVQIFSGVSISGTWIVPEIFSKWFDFGNADDLRNFRNLVSMSSDLLNNIINVDAGNYNTSKSDGAVLQLKSNTTINLNGATINVIANSDVRIPVILVDDVENVSILGGTIVGDITTHTSSGGTSDEWNHGIKIAGHAKNIRIAEMTIRECHGDGVDIINRDTDNPSYIEITNVILDDNGRNGISIEGGHHIRIVGCTITDTSVLKNIAPGCGIDIEPWEADGTIFDVVIERCSLSGNYNLYELNLLTNTRIGNNNFENKIIIKDVSVSKGFRIGDTNNLWAERLYAGAGYSLISNSKNIQFDGFKLQNRLDVLNTSNLGISNGSVNYIDYGTTCGDGNELRKVSISDTLSLTQIDGISMTDCNIAKVRLSNAVFNIDSCVIGSILGYAGTVHTGVIENSQIAIPEEANFYGGVKWRRNIITYAKSIKARGTGTEFVENMFFASVDTLLTPINAQGAGITILLVNNVFSGNFNQVLVKNVGSEVVTYLSSLFLPAIYNNGLPTTALRGSLNVRNGNLQMYDGSAWETFNMAKSGVTANRPSSPVAGMTYYDTSLGKLIVYNGSAWVNVDGSALS